MVSAVSTTGMFKESVVSMRLPPDCLAWMVVVEERKEEFSVRDGREEREEREQKRRKRIQKNNKNKI